MSSIANKKNYSVLKKINESEKKQFEKALSPMILLIVFL
jgi:hypothetical protein